MMEAGFPSYQHFNLKVRTNMAISQLTQKSDTGTGWFVNPDFTITCIGCNEVTTPVPTSMTIPDGSIPCVVAFYEAGYYFPEQQCDGIAQVGFRAG